MTLKSRLVSIVLFISVPAFAADTGNAAPAETQDKPTEYKSYAMGLAGGYAVTSTGGGSGATFSGRAGTCIYQDHSGMLSLGADIGSWSNSATTGSVTANASIIPILAELVTRRAFGTGLYFGGRAGVAITSVTVQSGALSASASSTSFAFAPVAGYEIDATPNVSVAVDLSWLNRSGMTLTFPSGTSFNFDSSAAFLMQAGVAVRF